MSSSTFTMLQSRIGCIIPLYVSPTSGLWNTIISEKQRRPNVPIAVVVNPTGSGVGTAAQSAWTTLITNLNNANIITLGYVYTNFGEEAQITVEGEITNWKTFYPGVKGIFFAAMSNQASKQTYYTNLHTYARITRGFVTTCGEAGNDTPQTFFGSTCADTIIVYEGFGAPLPANYSQYDALSDNNVGLIVLGLASMNHEWANQISAYAGWLYMTNDGGANPFDTLPTYFSSLIDRLDAIGAGLSTGSNTDTFGIRKIYHTKAAGEEWYVNLSNPTTDERFQNEPSLTRNSDGSWAVQGSSGNDYQVRLEAWSPAYSTTTARQAARWFNVEITGYVRCDEEFVVTGNYMFQWYSRGGHHTDSQHCEGSALKGALYRRRISSSDAGIGFAMRKEICHASYTGTQGVSRNAIPWTSTGFYNEWLGMKLIIYNVVESGNTYTKTECWIDSDVQDNNGNLSIQNNWRFISSYVDRGGWFGDQSTFDRDCGGCGYPRDRIHITPGGNTTSGSANFNRNLVAWRTDGIRWRFLQLTAREIDPTKPATGDPTPPPTTDPASAFDNFGVRRLYPTKSGGAEWYLASTPTSDSRFTSNATTTRNADGSYRMLDNSAIVWTAAQPNGFNASLTATGAANHGQCAARGYMQDSLDWKNVEMTVYVRLNGVGSGGGELGLYCRGGRHQDPTPNCEGSSMKGFLDSNGNSRFAKEQYHIAYHYTATTNQIGQSLQTSNWVGMKYICYNRIVSGSPTIRQEIWVDIDNSNTWIKVDERNDTGQWGINGLTCNGLTDDQQITWGGPLAGFRADNCTNIDVKWYSVREIDGDAIATAPPPPQPPASCGT